MNAREGKMSVPIRRLGQEPPNTHAYEDYAERYDALVRHVPNQREQKWLKRLVKIAGKGGRISGSRSGPGYDADFVEGLGVQSSTHRRKKRFSSCRQHAASSVSFSIFITTISAAPIRGAALCVLIHVPREQTDQVLAKISRSLRRRRLPRIDAAHWRWREERRYHTVYWRRDDFAAVSKAPVGPCRDEFNVGRDAKSGPPSSL